MQTSFKLPEGPRFGTSKDAAMTGGMPFPRKDSSSVRTSCHGRNKVMVQSLYCSPTHCGHLDQLQWDYEGCQFGRGQGAFSRNTQ